MFNCLKMPAFEFCNRKWRIGSDEFIVPFAFEAAVRYIWLVMYICYSALKNYITFIVLFSTPRFLIISFSWYFEAQYSNCVGGHEVQILMGTEIGILLINIIVNFFLVKYSMRGAIMDTHLRKNVPIILSLRYDSYTH